MPSDKSNQTAKKGRFSLSLPGKLQITAWTAIILVFAISVMDLVGWTFAIQWLKSLGPFWVAMKIIKSLQNQTTTLNSLQRKR